MSWNETMAVDETIFQDFVKGNRSESCSDRHLWINVIALRDEAVLYMEVASTRLAAMKIMAG